MFLLLSVRVLRTNSVYGLHFPFSNISFVYSRTTFAEYSNVDLNMVNEYCFVVIDSNSESYNAPSVGRYLCTPQAIGFQIGIDMNAGNFYARGHNWGSFSDWRSFSFS